jgi:predicted DNA-binding transcriptional regulator YafY
MAADYSRIHRLLRIVTLIQSERGWSAARLAQELGTTERNIYRDLKMLQGAGIPFHHDLETRGYVIRRDFFMPAVSLTFEESLALLALGEHVGGEEQIPYTRPAAKAISKIRCNLPPAVQKELAKMDGHVSIKLSAVNPPEGAEDVYETVREALADRKVLSCDYEAVSSGGNGRGNGGKESGVFQFRPYALFFSQRAWYAVGHHSSRNAVRCLKLNRFVRCRLTQEKYEIPKSFSMSRHLGNAWRMIRGETTYDIELQFDGEFAETVSDTHWHQTQEIEWNDDGSILFRCRVDGLEEIVWWILSMGPHCKVRRPQELADRVRSLAGEMVRQYAD